MFDSDPHPHVPAGSPEGGQFARKDDKPLRSLRTFAAAANKQFDTLSLEEEQAIRTYAGQAHIPINAYLRKGHTEEVFGKKIMTDEEAKTIAKKIVSSMKPIPFSVDAWRGLSYDPTIDLKEGDVFTDAGIISATPNKYIASYFSPNTRLRKNVYAHFIVPKGTPAVLWMGRTEHEVMLKPGTKFRYVKRTAKSGNIMGGEDIVELEIVK